jgi:hypothetical protein
MGAVRTIDREWVSVSQAAQMLGLTPARVRQMTNAGGLKHKMTPLGRLIDTEDVERLHRERSAKAEERVTHG